MSSTIRAVQYRPDEMPSIPRASRPGMRRHDRWHVGTFLSALPRPPHGCHARGSPISPAAGPTYPVPAPLETLLPPARAVTLRLKAGRPARHLRPWPLDVRAAPRRSLTRSTCQSIYRMVKVRSASPGRGVHRPQAASSRPCRTAMAREYSSTGRARARACEPAVPRCGRPGPGDQDGWREYRSAARLISCHPHNDNVILLPPFRKYKMF
jgi:hypothetical protein